jgi:hypothetical protein
MRLCKKSNGIYILIMPAFAPAEHVIFYTAFAG